MNTRNVLIATLVALMATGTAFAAISKEHADWGKGPGGYLMTADEAAAWKNVKTDAEAQAFIDLFWARRDPTPATPANEFRDAIDQRIKYADENFTQGRTKGSMTDRGHVFIVMGTPASVQRTGPQSTIQSPNQRSTGPGGVQDYSPKQLWLYEAGKMKIVKLPAPTAEFAFVDQYASNEFKIERTGKVDHRTVLADVSRQYVTQPQLTAVPKFDQKPVATALPASAPAVTTDALKTEAFRSAITAFRAAKENPYKPASLYFTEMVTPSGDYFVPVQLYVPKSTGLSADSVTTFFGVIEDANGAPVMSFEEPATLSTSRGDLYFDRSLKLQPGTYRATLGLSDKDSKPVIMTSRTLELKPLSPTTQGVSRLVLAADVHETPEAAPVGTPYAFGRLKVVPKGDAVFTNKDDITYFVELLGFGIDEGTSLPKVQVKVELAGKPLKQPISAPPMEAAALPLSGAPGPGQYAIISTLPLGAMKNPVPPGEYTLRLKMTDQVTKQSFTAEQPMTIVAAQ